MIVLDASVLIAHFYPRDAHHVTASEFLECAVEDELAVHHITLVEVLVGAMKVGRAEQMLTDLMAGGVGVVDAAKDDVLGLARVAATTGLKIPDACVLHAAQSNSAAMATFDKALAKAAVNLGVPLAID